jgi:hypothetical protein
VAASPDGENWTSWYPTTGAHMDGEISPTYPDGSPNPNYGFILGDTAFFGNGLYTYFKYSVTLYSETKEAPVVSNFRLYYQDSTMGDGYLVIYKDPKTGQSEF